jgi:K+-sensing histidine kinase KdpD
LAVAISNADLYQQAQESLEAERRAYGEFSRQSWNDLLRAQPNLGFLRRERGISVAGDVWHAEMETALQTGQTTPGGDSTERLATPIKVRGHVIGVIDAQRSGDAAGWTREQIALLEALADQIGTALESARLYQEAQRRAARERLTSEVTARVRASLDIETVLRNATREIAHALGLAALDVRLGTEPEVAGE